MTSLLVLALPDGVGSAPRGAATCARFAAPRGDDRGAGTQRRPFRTVQRLADSLAAGQAGCLAGGTYRDVSSSGYVLRVEHGGEAKAPITIRSAPGERARLVGIVYVPRGSDYVTLSALDIEGTGGQNTIKVNAAGVTIENSDVTNGWRGSSCLVLGDSSGYGRAVRPIVRRNRFHECGRPADGNRDHSIYVNDVVGGRIVGNVFWNHAAYAIHLYPQARRMLVAHNVIDGGAPSVRGGVIFAGDASYASSDNVVEYNVIAYAQTYDIDSWWGGRTGSGNVARHNCLWAGRQGNINLGGGGFKAYGNVVADPLFVARRRHDYRLRAASRCRRVVGIDAAALVRRR